MYSVQEHRNKGARSELRTVRCSEQGSLFMSVKEAIGTVRENRCRLPS